MLKTNHYKGHRWTNEELVKLMKLWAAGVTMAGIINELNSTQVAVLKQIQRMRKNGIPLARRQNGHPEGKTNVCWTQGEVEYLLRRRNEKATSEEVSAELGRSANAVDAMIQKLRKENVIVAMRGNGVRRLWDAESLKVVTMHNVFESQFEVEKSEP